MIDMAGGAISVSWEGGRVGWLVGGARGWGGKEKWEEEKEELYGGEERMGMDRKGGRDREKFTGWERERGKGGSVKVEESCGGGGRR